MQNELQERGRSLEGAEKKIICPTYDGLVRTLAGEMEVDTKKLYEEPKTGFDHEDINSWIGLVGFKDGKTPDVMANISSEQGKRVVKIDVQKQKPLESINEKASNADLIYTMALTEAKMKVVAEAAEETYPAVAFQINDLRKDWAKMREEVLSDAKDRDSLNDLMNRMMSRRVMMTATLLVIGGMILSACGMPANGTETATPETGTKPAITETVPSITLEAETPTVEVSPTQTEKELTIADIGPEDRIYDRGVDLADKNDVPLETGIFPNPDIARRNLPDDQSVEIFGETGLKVEWLSGFVAEKPTYDESTGILTIPLMIEVDGVLRRVNVKAVFTGDNIAFPVYFLGDRLFVGLPGYDLQTDNKRSVVFRKFDESFFSKFEKGKQIILLIPAPDSKQQYIDGLVKMRKDAVQYGLPDTDMVIRQIDFLLENIDSDEGYPAYQKLDNNSFSDGDSVYVMVIGFQVPVLK